MSEYSWPSENPCDEMFPSQGFLQDLNQQNVELLNQSHNSNGIDSQFLNMAGGVQYSPVTTPGSGVTGASNVYQHQDILFPGPPGSSFDHSLSSKSSPQSHLPDPSDKSGVEPQFLNKSAMSPVSMNDDKNSRYMQQQMQQMQQQMQQHVPQQMQRQIPQQTPQQIPQQIQQIPTNGAKTTKRGAVEEAELALLSREDSELTEEELQAKKKIQNRAAQRAFRERKEQKLKTLEERLNKSEADNQKLLDQLKYFRTQNEKQQQLLIATENSQQQYQLPGSEKFVFPTNISQTAFVDKMSQGHNLSPAANLLKVYNTPAEPTVKLLTVGAVWDYLHLKAEEYDREEFFDVVGIMDSLKGNEKCHGFGPAYPVDLVDQAIQASLGN